MIEPILSLALAVQSKKSVYALLVGSGVSRAAGIPTGWEIVLDLICKLALLKNENPGPNPEEWYRRTFGEEPSYSRLLDAVAKTPAERNQLLKGYFEPTDDERAQGLKLPTVAHKAIAQLVANGYVRVLITTNFDRLLEKAIEAVGIVPTVISNPDTAEGALPIAHTACTIIKLHGDYLDTRIKNSPAELQEYDARMNLLLDRVLDEYGLVICGWSAEWDVALRAAFERCKSRRFTTFWATKEEPREHAKHLIEFRQAEVIRIKDADAFFHDVAEKVFALEELGKPHPLSAKIAVATVKKYLSDQRHRIALHDLITGETERLRGKFTDQRFPTHQPPPDASNVTNRVQQYESLAEILQAMLITECYWDEGAYQSLWVKCLDRIANPPGDNSGLVVWVSSKKYPGLLILYGAGIACLAGKQYGTLAHLLTNAKIRDGGREYPLALLLYTHAALSPEIGRLLPGMERRHTPVSDHLAQVLRDPLRDILPSDYDYDDVFDRFEYTLALVCAWLKQKENGRIWGPVGRFGWRNTEYLGRSIMDAFANELAQLGVDWPLLKAGLFDGSLETLQSVKSAFDSDVRRLGW
jgi:hypothetical protein